ncbi:NFX1-type zinc finger-containing protein 1-like [Gigantopelta aegis]|uniref:NFX1-type zinc finger-containing protein 1-like n=1 Tax=Gigantopelta aegis TaxID=1735272 RepID=UPI001B88D292|nr:NFX1-type zinc finger-containing protein 1-like [Gigantopelta aegis]
MGPPREVSYKRPNNLTPGYTVLVPTISNIYTYVYLVPSCYVYGQTYWKQQALAFLYVSSRVILGSYHQLPPTAHPVAVFKDCGYSVLYNNLTPSYYIQRLGQVVRCTTTAHSRYCIKECGYRVLYNNRTPRYCIKDWGYSVLYNNLTPSYCIQRLGIQTATVIGMTTTGAARYQKILSEIKPKIVVVEEAAEVLEGHIITTLSQGCEHLILIGDHKQLKPNPNVYKLAKKYCLDLSLFERMINNGVQCNTLEIQHRMRPEISSLMTHIYPNLKDDESVKAFPNIMGVSQNLFFLTHNHPEKHDTEMVSHSNEFEAAYVKEFCLYLLKQGYDRSQITVLTTYSGQLLALKKLMPKDVFGGVRVTVVDNFQGEENDIILLSLVRSNEENSVGFLKIENRICVALSRAKHGLFVIGNFDLLSENSELWKALVRDCRTNEQIGPGLKLFCQNHPKDAGFVATKGDDFKKAPEGGCMKPCEFRLECGHVCTRPCHPYDRDHAEYQCNKPCTKVICENSHQCTRRCFQECGKCMVKIEKIVPICQHKQMIECHLDPRKFSCRENCNKILPCGHKCGVLCGSTHQCTEWVKKTFDCGHSADVRCERQHTAKCNKKCTTKLLCGHGCKGNCQICHNGKLHKSCSQNCSRILVCGHECTSTCSNCPPCEKVCENRCPHSKCFKKCGELCVPCMEPCGWVCRHRRCVKKCSEPCNRDPCNQPCEKPLRCGHQCIGMCGEPCPRLCRVCNKEEVTAIFFGTEDEEDARFVELEDCGHVVEVSGLDHWMQSQTHTDGNAEQALQLKTCPICKTVIRQNMRYGKLIRERLRDIEQVKRRVLGSKHKIRQLEQEIQIQIQIHISTNKYNERKEIYEHGYNNSETGLTAILNQLEFLSKIENMISKFEKFNAATALLRIHVKLYLADLERFRQWILAKKAVVLSEQEVSDAQRELERYNAALGILRMEKILKDKNIQLDSVLEEKLQRVKRYVGGKRPYLPERQQYVKTVVDEIKKLAPDSGLGISDAERVSIVKAMGLSTGHWFKCKNGHIYAIGDCGGATVESRCPECNAAIGGGDHRLRSDNALATEMDGARHAAWSEQANLGNFLLDDLI